MILPSAVPFEINADKSITTAMPDSRRDGKISGTTLAGVLGMSEYDTPFTTACKLLAVYREDISRKPAVKAGIALESVILDYARNVMGEDVIPAEELFGPQPEDYYSWESHFDDPDFSGHVDGVRADGAVVEVKTAGDPTKWYKNGEIAIPTHYHLQASLYARMMGADKILFLLGVVKPADVSNPTKWDPEGNVFAFEVAPIAEIDEYIATARTWRDAYVARGMTPAPTDDPRDFKVLEALSVQVDEDIAETYALDLDFLTDEWRDKKRTIETAKDMLKLRAGYLDEEEMTVGEYRITVSPRSTTRVDTDALKRDGIYDKYAVESRYKIVKTDRKM